MQLCLTEKVMFGAPVAVLVDAHSHSPLNIENITVPSLEEGEVQRCHLHKHAFCCSD